MADTSLWPFASVYIAPTGSVPPTSTTDAWPAAWEEVGLLDPDTGMSEGRDEDTSDFYAWGGKLIYTTHSKHKRTWTFAALEDNAVVFDLINPGSTRAAPDVNGVVSSTVKVPTYGRFAIGVDLHDGTTTKRRWSVNAGLAEVGDIKESETDPTMYEITVTLYPGDDGVIYHELRGPSTTP